MCSRAPYRATSSENNKYNKYFKVSLRKKKKQKYITHTLHTLNSAEHKKRTQIQEIGSMNPWIQVLQHR